MIPLHTQGECLRLSPASWPSRSRRARPSAGGSCLLASLCLICGGSSLLGQTSVSAEHFLVAGQAASLERHYSEAIRILKQGLQNFPDDNRIRIELGRVYMFTHRDTLATRLFREALHREPGNREAKLELARALGYRHDYQESNQLYQQLLNADEHGEAAEIGLASNLIHQGRRAEARQLVMEGLAHHPNSLILQEYADRLEKSELGGDQREPARRVNQVQTSTDYVSDSAGNHFWQASQRFDYMFAPGVSNHLEAEQRWLRHPGHPSANVASGTDEVHFQLTDPVAISLGGGGVRFADGSGRLLYRSALDFHPARQMWLGVSFSRTPFYPDTRSARFDLTREGWLAIFDWQPGPWRANAWWSRQHYSDGNVERRQSAEVLRWIGSPRVAVGAGYRLTHYDFKQDLNHGYFSPDEYTSHLGITGLSLRVGKSYHGEYLARIGAESLARGAPFKTAWEVSVRNWVQLGKWELGADYFYSHVAQSTGAFSAQAGRLAATYRF